MRLCAGEHKTEDIELLDHFDSFPFGLSDFQKYALEGIVKGNDILITAHTGSGKTLPAEFAITFFTGKGKKVIYTSPIKALSNQKFHEFTQKFPDISIGLLTGDIKMNPAADVLIMTTEILNNHLYNKSSGAESFLLFDLNFDNLGCVIFDEVHYINDSERGHVWEESIMNLPPHIQMVMLSATINDPSKFATWCEKKYQSERQVWLIPTHTRIVPLTHYGFVVTNTQCLKSHNKDKQKEIKAFANNLHIVKNSSGIFNEKNYYEIQNFLKMQSGRITTRHVLNEVCSFMVEQQMLPALCFVLSRKQLEKCAKGVTCVLLEDDSKVPYIIAQECEAIIRRLPNFQEYLRLPEYCEMVKLLEKGIAIHHAGVMPVLREMVEILYAKGFVKLLFATETFAVGVNMPTKSVIFTDIAKHDGNSVRGLFPHEYTQMAGRAGRRGIDKVGNVILLYNLFSKYDITSHREMLYGNPATLTSKFTISPSLLLNLISTKTDISEFVKKSMASHENEMGEKSTHVAIHLLKKKMEGLIPKCSASQLEEYDLLTECVKSSGNRKRKNFQKQLEEIPSPDQMTRDYHSLDAQVQTHVKNLSGHEAFVEESIAKGMNLLRQRGFVEDSENVPQLTTLGFVASQIKEVDSLLMSKLIMNGTLDKLTTQEMAGLFSCFADKKHSRELHVMLNLFELVHKEMDEDAELTYEFVENVMEWVDCNTESECKLVLQKTDVFLGDFVKVLLKIVNIAREVEKVALFLNLPFIEAVSNIPNVLLKYVANSQTLYI